MTARVPIALTAALSAAALVACGERVLRGPGGRARAATDTRAADSAQADGSQGGAAQSNRPRAMATGIDVPWGLAFLPGRRRAGERAQQRPDHAGRPAAPPARSTASAASPAAARAGCSASPCRPTYAQDQLVYAYFTAARTTTGSCASSWGAGPQDRVRRHRPRRIHNGGRIAFGPDGMLYAGTGDAAARPRAEPVAPNGKILRLNPEGQSGRTTRSTARRLVLGHRNVQGLAWDAQGRLWATEFGQNPSTRSTSSSRAATTAGPRSRAAATAGGRFGPAPLVADLGVVTVGRRDLGGTLYVAALRGERLWLVPLTDAGAGNRPSSSGRTAASAPSRSRRTVRCGSPRRTPTAAATNAPATTGSCASASSGWRGA